MHIPDNLSLFSRNLKRIRKRLSLTQEELGELLDLSRPQVARYENCRIGKLPSGAILQKLACLAGIKIDQLIGTELKEGDL